MYPSCGLINSPENGLEVVLAGYGTSEIFNVDSGVWREGPDLPNLYLATSAQIGNTFVIVGGYDGFGFLDTIYSFDEVNYEWIELPQKLQRVKQDPGVVALPRNAGITC